MKNGSTAIKIVLIFSALAIIAAVLLGYFLTRSIVSPLRKAMKIAKMSLRAICAPSFMSSQRMKPVS